MDVIVRCVVGVKTSITMKRNESNMAKFEIEVEDCKHCPCLRINEFGEFYCFFNTGHTISEYDLNEIDSECPLIEDN